MKDAADHERDVTFQANATQIRADDKQIKEDEAKQQAELQKEINKKKGVDEQVSAKKAIHT